MNFDINSSAVVAVETLIIYNTFGLADLHIKWASCNTDYRQTCSV